MQESRPAAATALKPRVHCHLCAFAGWPPRSRSRLCCRAPRLPWATAIPGWRAWRRRAALWCIRCRRSRLPPWRRRWCARCGSRVGWGHSCLPLRAPTWGHIERPCFCPVCRPRGVLVLLGAAVGPCAPGHGLCLFPPLQPATHATPTAVQAVDIQEPLPWPPHRLRLLRIAADVLRRCAGPAHCPFPAAHRRPAVPLTVLPAIPAVLCSVRSFPSAAVPDILRPLLGTICRVVAAAKVRMPAAPAAGQAPICTSWPADGSHLAPWPQPSVAVAVLQGSPAAGECTRAMQLLMGLLHQLLRGAACNGWRRACLLHQFANLFSPLFPSIVWPRRCCRARWGPGLACWTGAGHA